MNRTRWAFAALTALAGSVLSGCSMLPGSASATATTTPGTSTTAVAADGGNLLDETFPAVADVTIKKCAGSGGTWTVSGTAHNPTKLPFDYTVYVALLDKAGSPLDNVVATPTGQIKPGANGTWTAVGTSEPSAVVSCRVAQVQRS